MNRPFGALDYAPARQSTSSGARSSTDELEEVGMGTGQPGLDDGRWFHEPGDTWGEESEAESLAAAHVTLPGMTEPGEGCGEWAPREFCDSCGEVHHGPHRCQQRGCPDCWSTWATQRAERIVRRLQAARYKLPDGIERRAVHMVVSPPEGEVPTLADIGRYRKKAHEKAREAGMRGGVCVFHGFRITEEAKREYRESVDGDGRPTNSGAWRFVRENDRHWRNQVYWSPHYHYIGLATEVEPDPSDGWVVERLSTAAPMEGLRDEEAYESLAKIGTYILSHATFEVPDPDESGAGRKAVTWYGAVHPSNYQPDPEAFQNSDRWEEREPTIEPPSKGAYLAIKRMAAEATGAIDPEEDAPLAGEPEECPDEACTGHLRSIFELHTYRGRMDVGRERDHRLVVAFKWAIGEVLPPPGPGGRQAPREEEECARAFEELVEEISPAETEPVPSATELSRERSHGGETQ